MSENSNYRCFFRVYTFNFFLIYLSTDLELRYTHESKTKKEVKVRGEATFYA